MVGNVQFTFESEYAPEKNEEFLQFFRHNAISLMQSKSDVNLKVAYLDVLSVVQGKYRAEIIEFKELLQEQGHKNVKEPIHKPEIIQATLYRARTTGTFQKYMTTIRKLTRMMKQSRYQGYTNKKGKVIRVADNRIQFNIIKYSKLLQEVM